MPTPTRRSSRRSARPSPPGCAGRSATASTSTTKASSHWPAPSPPWRSMPSATTAGSSASSDRRTLMGIVIAILVGAILGFLAYCVCALFLPYVVAVLVGVLVFLLVVFGGPRYYDRGL